MSEETETQNGFSSHGTAPKESFQFKNDLDRELHERLAEIGPGPAQFYLDACFLLGNARHQMLPASTTHLVAHLFREIDSAIVNLFAPFHFIKSTENSNSVGTGKVRAALQFLQISSDHPAYSAWIRFYTKNSDVQFHELAHRHDFHPPRPFDESFTDWVSTVKQTWQAILEAYRRNFVGIVSYIDSILPLQHPPREIRARIPLNEVCLDYLFKNLDQSEWLFPLLQKGFFGKPDDLVLDENGRLLGNQIWPQVYYLTRMAAVDSVTIQQQVLAIMLEVGPTNNFRIHHHFAEAALNLPIDLAKEWAEHEVRWLESGNLSRGMVEEELAKLAVKLCEGGEIGTALRLMEEILNVLPDPEAEAKKQEAESEDAFGLLNRTPEPWIRCDPYHYKQILEHQLPVLGAAAPIQTTQMLSRLLLKTVEYSQRDPDKTRPHDLFHISRQAIEDEKEHGEYDFGQNLISALRDSCESVLRENPTRISEIVSLLTEKEWSIFQRIVLYLFQNIDGIPHTLVREKLLSEDFFNDPFLWHEYSLVLQKHFGKLKEEDQNVIFHWIDQAVERKKSNDDFNKEESFEFKVKSVLAWQHERLDFIKAFLRGEWRDRYDALEKEFPHRDIPFGYSSWIGDVGFHKEKTPMTAEDLLAISNEEIVHFLRTWEPPKDRFGPSPSSLSAALATAVEQDPDRVVSELPLFLHGELDRTYLRGLMNGLCRAALGDRADLVESALDLCSDLLKQQVTIRDLDLPAHVRDGFDADEGWRPIQSAMVSFAEDLCDSKRETPFALREKIWSIIEPLANADEPDLAYETKHVDDSWDVATASLNVLRGKALHAMMTYSMWVARHLKALHPKKRPHLDNMPEVRDILGSRLDLAAPFGQRQVDRAVIGNWIPQIVALNEDWMLGHFPEIFPSEPELRPLRLACFATTILYVGRLYDKLIPVYLEEVELLEGQEIGERKSRDYERRLAEHVVLFYAWEKAGLEEGGLVDRFFCVAPPALTAHAMEFLGHDMHSNKDEPVNRDVQARLKILWDWRVEMCGGIEKLPEEELKAFGSWFAWGEFEPGWAMPYMKASIRGPGLGHVNSYVFERVSEIFETCPEECLKVTELFVETNQDPWFFVGTRKQRGVWSLLEKAMQHPAPEIQTQARALINLIGSKGHLEYRELLERSDA